MPTYCSKQEPAANLQSYFSNIRQYLTTRWCNDNDKLGNVVDPVLRKILQHTMEAEDLRKEVGNHLKPKPIGVVVCDY